MPGYKAPTEDFRFLLFDLLKISERTDLPGFEDLSEDLVMAVLEGGAKICEEVLQPLNQIGDEQGCHLENGVVRTPEGFKEAYKQFCEGGWNALGASPELGGAGMPSVVTAAMQEMGASSNQAFAMYGGLTTAAYGALQGTGEPWMKELVVPKMMHGEWCGTMCLTEPHCGTDLKLMKTRAVEQEDGTYRLSGTKIFISRGDHDMVDNIIHMVIAKIPGEDGKLADDLSTVNFFMVPKININPEDGTMTDRNGVTVGSVEKKMGIKGNATCVLNFDDAVAYRLGPKPQKAEPTADGKKKSSASGMAGMFGMMNAARMGVGLQGIGAGEVAYQNAVTYSQERLAGRALDGVKNPDGPADPIIVYPDVRRMLLQASSFTEGARALAAWVSLMFSEVDAADEKTREVAGDMTQLMTPIIKAFFTDMGFEAANAAMQCFGGHGYIREHGMEQFVRDARINQIYEGANGVQALDLVGRKLAMNGGRPPLTFFGLVDDFVKANPDGTCSAPLKAGLEDLQAATMWLMEHALKDRNNAGAASAEYLRMFGIVAVGFMWAQMAKIASEKLAAGEGNPNFYKAKLVRATYWMERVMPDTASLKMRACAGADNLMELDAEMF